jgi:Arc/MetJ-type ribon-helix-helix transcriptional regulator
MPGGKRRTNSETEKVGTTLSKLEHGDLVRAVEGGAGVDRSDFVRQAIREKLERWKREHPLGVQPPKGR